MHADDFLSPLLLATFLVTKALDRNSRREEDFDLAHALMMQRHKGHEITGPLASSARQQRKTKAMFSSLYP